MSDAVPPRIQRWKQNRVGRLLSGLLVAMLGMMGLASVPTAAFAATQGTITSVNFTNETFDGGSRQEISVDWMVEDNPSLPLSVSIDLPEELRGYADAFPATGADGSKAGECTVTSTKITCEIDDDYIKQNPRGISGSFKFFVEVRIYNTEVEEHTFDIGGVTSPPVTVKPNPSVCVEACEYEGTWGWKHGDYHANTDTITWTVGVRAQSPQGLEAGKKVTVTDFLDLEAYELVKPPTVHEAGSVRMNPKTNREEPVWNEMPADLVEIAPDNLSVNFTSRGGATGKNARPDDRKISGGFYMVWWETKVRDEGKAGTYTNKAEWVIEGVDRHTHTGTAVRQGGSGNVVGTNFGKFAVTKQLTGDAVFSESPEFTLDWVAYANAEDTVGTPGTTTIKAGQTYTSAEFFKGSRVVLTEVTPSDSDNVAWSKPLFVATDAKGTPLDGATPSESLELTFSADNNNLARVSFFTLTNEAVLKKAPIQAKKVVENPDGVDLSGVGSYTLNYSYEAGEHYPAGSGTLDLPADGSIVATEELPLGAAVTFSEVAPEAIAGANWGTPVLSPATLVVGEDTEATVTVTNTIAKETGGFSLQKSLSGSGAQLVPEGTEFRVNWAHPEGAGYAAGSGEVIVVAGGDPVRVDGLPAGAEITLTEAAPDPVTGGSWLDPVFSKSTFTVLKDQLITIDLDNPITLNSGDFKLRKVIDGSGAELVSPETTFSVGYSYPAGKGFAAGAGTITVAADGEWVSSGQLPFGAEVTLTELDPAPIPGGTWDGHSFDHETFVVGDGSSVEITLTNTVKRDVTSFELVKELRGDAANLVNTDREYTFEYSYPEGDTFAAGKGTATVRADGEPVRVNNIPADAVITLTEVAPEPVAGATWQPVAFDGPSTFPAKLGNVTTLIATNEITRDLGGFGVRKVLAGDGAELVAKDAEFEVRYSYPAGDGFEAGEGSLKVSADGTVALVEGLPAGAVVTLSEVPAKPIKDATWERPKFSTGTLTVGNGEIVDVTLTNTITKTPPTEKPNKENPPGGKLAESGSGPLQPVGVAAMLLLVSAGAAMAWRGVRRSRAVK